MSRDLNHLANLNTLDHDGNAPEEQKEEELRMFTNTTFFDLDVGRSTDIATTVDELLIQQERQIQYPHKQQPLDDSGPVAGPSFTQALPQASGQQLREQRQRLEQEQEEHEHEEEQERERAHEHQNLPLPFDFSTLQGFSLAGELPQASLSIYDVDPIIQSQRASATPHRAPRPQPIQRHELAEQLARHQESQMPQWSEDSRRRVSQVQDVTPETSPSDNVDSHMSKALLSEEKRRRNTAASARFRSKKKMREQELERQHKAMQQQISDQTARIKQLEMENIWLRDLVMEKNTARDSSSLDALRASMLDREASSAKATH